MFCHQLPEFLHNMDLARSIHPYFHSSIYVSSPPPVHPSIHSFDAHNMPLSAEQAILKPCHVFSVVVNCGFLYTNKNGYTIYNSEHRVLLGPEWGLKMHDAAPSCVAPHPSFCADIWGGQMFIAIIKQPLLWLHALSVPFSLFLPSFHFVLGWGDWCSPPPLQLGD